MGVRSGNHSDLRAPRSRRTSFGLTIRASALAQTSTDFARFARSWRIKYLANRLPTDFIWRHQRTLRRVLADQGLEGLPSVNGGLDSVLPERVLPRTNRCKALSSTPFYGMSYV
jgi:hypothetical protein